MGGENKKVKMIFPAEKVEHPEIEVKRSVWLATPSYNLSDGGLKLITNVFLLAK